MEYLIGVLLSAAVAGLATFVGLARERSFYPTVLIVIGSYYVLFAAIGASSRTLTVETVVGIIFLLAGVFGFKRNLWLVVGALIGHGLFDLVHHFLIDNPGVPPWWPGFCMTFDVLFGGWMAAYLIKHLDLSASKP